MLKLGMINFTNSLPFHAAFTLGEMDCRTATIHFGVPSELNRALRCGELDVSFISSAEYLEAQSEYELLPQLCIGARERVGSVSLYLRNSIRQLDERPVGLTTQSASSALLLRVLCEIWRVKPEFRPLPERGSRADLEGFLLIGDECLRNQKIPDFHTIDLAQAWYHATGLPFTFAVLAARKDVLPRQRVQIASLLEELHTAIEWARNHPKKIEKLALRSRVEPQMLRDYYQLLRYDFDVEQQQGLASFKQYAELYAHPSLS